ncbi:hypothetical protein P691DRAFT_301315 [Macrolepiota fuliginosa MF-IS2]|uniref:DUF6533 domain-containing protein n=1 Tax=Macrolepiota fuliginosa MF-IS2 TaxID=1400762 RepID=A0A9P6C4I8_9AGAR|nr:hypothetical protein P691DRAFT_301315 [Macrolepiota fuliginosa MF-IS2]
MSIDGFTPAEISNITSQYRIITYTYAAAITLVVYDSLILFRREVDYIYSGPRSLVKWIYVLVKMMGLIMFSHDFFTYFTTHNEPTVLGEAVDLWLSFRSWGYSDHQDPPRHEVAGTLSKS